MPRRLPKKGRKQTCSQRLADVAVNCLVRLPDDGDKQERREGKGEGRQIRGISNNKGTAFSLSR